MPNIRLIDHTGCGHPDPLRAARLLVYAKSTRLTQGEELQAKIEAMAEDELYKELLAVARSVRSSWEFVSFTFQCTNISRACMDQMTRTRYGVSFAAQALRVTDMSDFTARLPSTVKASIEAEDAWNDCMDLISETYQQLRSLDIPAQDARGIIPLNVHTAILARYDLRALADMCGKRDNPRAQDEFTEVAQSMKAAVYEIMPWTNMFLEPERTSTPHLDKLMRKILGTASPVDKPEINDALKDIDKLRATWG